MGPQVTDTVSGTCDARFAGVREVFADSLASGREVGAAVCVYSDGQPVVDLWGGMADPGTGRVWARDTIVSTFSVSKGVVSTMAHILINRGELDPDAPVSRYWPEFAAAGKEFMPVRNIMDHQAALCYVNRRLEPGDLYDWDLMTATLAETKPHWAWGEKPVYLNMTYGYLLGEVVRRISGKGLAQFMREEIAGPLGIDFHFALNAEQIARCASVLQIKPRAVFEAAEADPDSVFGKSMAGWGAGEDFNSAAWRQAQVGSGSGHGNARAIARLFACLGQGGTLDGVRLMGPATVEAARAFQCETDGEDPLLGVSGLRFCLGYELNSPPVLAMGPNPRTFGQWGAGGNLGFADIEASVAFGYTPNLMHDAMEVGPRAGALVDALYASL